MVCAFDLNETVLDLGGLDPLFERLLGDAGARRRWFQTALMEALTHTIAGPYQDFGQIGAAALEMVAAEAGTSVAERDRDELRERMLQLEAQPDAPEALARLGDAGVRVVALTNSVADTARAQLEHAGIADAFEQVLSADEVKRLKPAREVYLMGAERCGVEAGELWLVAAHAWDVAGALRAGCAAAFVTRDGAALDPLSERPQIVAPDLVAAAKRIVEVDG